MFDRVLKKYACANEVLNAIQWVNTCSKLTIETVEHGFSASVVDGKQLINHDVFPYTLWKPVSQLRNQDMIVAYLLR